MSRKNDIPGIAMYGIIGIYDEESSQTALEDDVDAVDEARDVVLSRVSVMPYIAIPGISFLRDITD